MTSPLPAPAPAPVRRWAHAADPGGAAGVRGVLRRQASGVAVLTAGASAPVGLCVTSLVTVALDPALVAFSISVRSASWATVSTAEHVVAHLLAGDQEDLARRFGRSGSAKFAPPTRWQRDDLGLPLLDGVLAWLVLAPAVRVPVEDHVLMVCRVVRAAENDDATGPLVHHVGRYARLEDR